MVCNGGFVALIPDSGLVHLPARHSVEETISKLKQILEQKGITLFAVIDHSGEAAKVGSTMRPTKLVIFGSPKAGTPVMLAASSSAIDLPLKILVWEDAQGKVWITYNSSAYLQQRHKIPQAVLANISVIDALAKTVAE
jgi:uncharacterized protein (DUF302 family)